jgi:ribonuclease P protein component
MGSAPRHLFGFGRDRRLRASREFSRLKSDGQRWVQGCLILNWAPSVSRAGSRLGVVTGSRIGSAVVRTRARRLLREAFRRNQHRLTTAVDLVLVARPSIAPRSAEAVERDFLAALKRVGLLQSEPQPGSSPESTSVPASA